MNYDKIQQEAHKLPPKPAMINSHSVKLLEQKRSRSIKGDEPSSTTLTHRVSARNPLMPTFTPKINLVSQELQRAAPVSELLTQDAKRRQLAKSASESFILQTDQQRRHLTPRSEKLMSHKLQTQIAEVLKAFEHE